jgi:hypothetical protein
VRCGKCGEVFNALAHLAEDASAFAPGETEIDLEFRADSILQSPPPMVPPRNPPPTDDFDAPGPEIARLQIIGWDGEEAYEPKAEDLEEPASEQIGETSLEFTLPPGELDRIFIETKKGARSPLAPQPPPHPEDVEILIAAAIASAAASSAAAPEAQVPSGFDVSEDARREMLSVLESPGDIETPERRTFIPWLIAAIASGLLLVAQVVLQNREWLAAHVPSGVSPPANLSTYQLRQWGVTGDPAADGTLRVRASILNTAAQLEPYPLLRVTLANRFGSSIGMRDFEPSEYVGKPTAKLLAPGERVDATMDILDPGKSAEGFEIDVCLRGADRKISCANDAASAQPKR